MHALIDGAIERARMVIAILVCTLLAGLYVYANMPKEAEPEIQIPYVGVTIPLEGVSPEDAERLLVRPAETELQTIEGLKQMDAYALDGAAQFVLEFDITSDIDQALVDVREKIDMAKREFPEDTREPVITEVSTSLFPVIVINLYGALPERGLYQIARDLQDRLEAQTGILEANIKGEREEVLEILVDPVKLEIYNISYADILQTVSANNRLVPAGKIDMGQGRYSIKVPGLIETAADAFDLPVKRNGDKVVSLKDVAEIRRTFKDREINARFNGEPSVSIEVLKRTGANILETVAEARAEVDRLRHTWPDTLEVTITSDNSELIGDQLGQLEASILTAVVLVMIIVVAALGVRSAGLVGISIPASFLMGFLLLALFGYTVNMMVLFGMVIAVGILVDGAIVVVEYADRKMAEGMDRKLAYGMAGKRMFWPIIASNATTLAAFMPFLFWNSIPGKFMEYLPITLIFVLSSSLVMALVFLPVLGGVLGGRPKGEGDDALKGLSGEEGDPLKAPGWIGMYARMITQLVARPWKVTLGILGVMACVFAWFVMTPHKSEFFLDLEPEKLYVFVGAQGNLSADEEYAIVKRAEDLIFTVPGIESISTQAGLGSESGGDFGEGVSEYPVDTIGKMLIDIAPHKAGVDGRKVEAEIRRRLEDFTGGHVEVQIFEQGPPSGKDLQLIVTGDNTAALSDAVDRVRAHLEAMGSVVEIEDTRPPPGIEWRLKVDRELAARVGADVTQVGAAVQLVTGGVLVGKFRPDDANDEVDIRVRFPEEARSVEALDDLMLATVSGPTPISSFVTRVPAPRIDKISRRDGHKIFTIRANSVEQGEGGALSADVAAWLDTQDFGPDVRIGFDGAIVDTRDAFKFFAVAGLASLFMMGVILLWEFNNFYHVALTLTAVILSVTGVLIGIQVASSYISVLMTGTGVVALAGIVVNNNIVLIDTFHRLRADGRSAKDAAVATAAQRLRPILLTTGTTVCGLLPMMFQLNLDFSNGTISRGGAAAEWWVPLSTAVVFGLSFSTIVTLLVTPVWLAAPEKMANWRDRMLGRSDGDGDDTDMHCDEAPWKRLRAITHREMRAAE